MASLTRTKLIVLSWHEGAEMRAAALTALALIGITLVVAAMYNLVGLQPGAEPSIWWKIALVVGFVAVAGAGAVLVPGLWWRWLWRLVSYGVWHWPGDTLLWLRFGPQYIVGKPVFTTACNAQGKLVQYSASVNVFVRNRDAYPSSISFEGAHLDIWQGRGRKRRRHTLNVPTGASPAQTLDAGQQSCYVVQFNWGKTHGDPKDYPDPTRPCHWRFRGEWLKSVQGGSFRNVTKTGRGP